MLCGAGRWTWLAYRTSCARPSATGRRSTESPKGAPATPALATACGGPAGTAAARATCVDELAGGPYGGGPPLAGPIPEPPTGRPGLVGAIGGAAPTAAAPIAVAPIAAEPMAAAPGAMCRPPAVCGPAPARGP